MLSKNVTELESIIGCCLLVICGCMPSTQESVVPKKPIASDSSEIVIVSGYGSEECHLEMDLSKLSKGWEPANMAFPGIFRGNTKTQASYYHKESDTLAHCQDGQVDAITYQFRSSDFIIRTAEGITRDSTLRDVFKAYGEPQSIIRDLSGDSQQDYITTIYICRH